MYGYLVYVHILWSFGIFYRYGMLQPQKYVNPTLGDITGRFTNFSGHTDSVL
jgi:hypothetical protein